jgi:hypothetical protein
VAKDFRIVIAAVSNVGWIEAGPWAGKKCIGSSLVIGSDGKDMLQAPYGPEAETICFVNIELQNRPAKGHAWTDYWNNLVE